jgi:hypothetical protein
MAFFFLSIPGLGISVGAFSEVGHSKTRGSSPDMPQTGSPLAKGELNPRVRVTPILIPVLILQYPLWPWGAMIWYNAGALYKYCTGTLYRSLIIIVHRTIFTKAIARGHGHSGLCVPTAR